MELILASKSPRRRELLQMIGLPCRTLVSDVDETAPDGLGPGELVECLAKQKAEAIFLSHPHACVIGADTIVYIDGRVIGKPKNLRDAFRILHTLQGRSHVVYTGVALYSPFGVFAAHEETTVTFAPMSKEEIDWYINTGEPMDKAGAYGVQGPGGMFVEKVDGNYFNVVGLPLPLLYRMLKQCGEAAGEPIVEGFPL